MIGRLAVRSLTAHPIRTAVLSAGFGVGVAVMAVLLGVAAVILEQAQSPALLGGGDVVIRMAPEVPARMVLSGTLQSDALRGRIHAVSPWHTESLFLFHDGRSTRVDARAGIPSLERAMGDPETASFGNWRDTPDDVAWTHSTPEVVLRQIDRFHPIPDVPIWADSWAEWLYFNGRGRDARFYLTFLVGPALPDGGRSAGVRLQLERNGHIETFGAAAHITEEEALRAPELAIGGSRVSLDGLRYVIDLDVPGRDGRAVRGRLVIAASPGRLVPPIEVAGARGWRTGYVVPVMEGSLEGTLDVAGDRVSLEGGSGYHDHNWGFWKGVSWQWGQVQRDGLSFIFGRVRPPAEAAGGDRFPGFVGAIGPDGPLGYATNVAITETNDAQGRPATMLVTGRSPVLDVRLQFEVQSLETTRSTQGPLSSGLDFLQMRGQYSVAGSAGERTFDFSAPGTAETFRGAADR